MLVNRKNAKTLFDFISKQIAFTLDIDFSITQTERVVGGDISESYRVMDNNNRFTFFIKINKGHFIENFVAEILGLNTIIDTHVLLAPKPIIYGEHLDYSFLVLEYLPLSSKSNDHELGLQLAKLHQVTQHQFGFIDDNFIGNTPQRNKHSGNWAEFWRDNRIRPQIELAYTNGYEKILKPIANQLLEIIPAILADHNPNASLVHGDLWSGNKAYLKDGTPVIYDPACYYGDRETDIAMTCLFGGFETDFYDAYHSIYPLDHDYLLRQPLYNLYHQLNHLNLFGGSYLNSCINTMTSMLREKH